MSRFEPNVWKARCPALSSADHVKSGEERAYSPVQHTTLTHKVVVLHPKTYPVGDDNQWNGNYTCPTIQGKIAVG